MRKFIYVFIVLFSLLFVTSNPVFAATCDQSFNGGYLRYDKGYRFYDVWNNNGNQTDYMNNFWVHYTENGTWNTGEASTWSYLDPGSDFDWTSQLKNNSYAVAANSSMRIIETNPTNWRIQKHPTVRTNGTANSYDFALRYKVSYDNSNNYPNTNDDIYHTECIYYSVTWCGDGVKDAGYEVCDPNDPSHAGWGNGGCSNTCEPINIEPQTTCDGLTVTPPSGQAPLSSTLSCTGTNTNSYQIACGNGQVINAQTGTCTYVSGGNYTARCTVNGNVTSTACTQTVSVTMPTPLIEIQKFDANTADLDGNIGNDTQTVATGTQAVFKIRVKNIGNEALRNVQVTDAIAPNCAGNVTLPSTKPTTWSNFVVAGSGNHTNNTLEPGEYFEYTCSKANTTAPYNNRANTQGTGVTSGTNVYDTDDTAVLLVSPSIQVVKTDANTADLDGNIGNDTQTVNIGEKAVFKIRITNNGTEDLKNISLTDAIAPNCSGNVTLPSTKPTTWSNFKVLGSGNHTDEYLQPGEYIEYTCEKLNTTAGYTNEVGVTAKGKNSNINVNDDDASLVRIVENVPACVSLNVNPLTGNSPLTSNFVCTGDYATSYQVNCGNGQTFNSASGSCNYTSAGTYQVVCNVNGNITSQACQKTVTVSTPQNYDLALRKTLVTTGALNIGDDVTFRITVFNQGEIAANTITVTDYIPTGLTLNDSAWTFSGNKASRTITNIPAGTQKTFTIKFKIAANAPTTIRNFAEISMDDGNDCDSIPDAINRNQEGETIATGMVDNQIGTGCNSGGDEDDHDYEDISVGNVVQNYDLALRKTLSALTPGQPARHFKRGDNVTFTITVFNQGTIAANTIEVTDYIPTGLTLNDSSWVRDGDQAKRTIQNIQPGESKSVTISFTIDNDSPRTVKNLAEISTDDGDDCDSTPDNNPSNDGFIIDNNIGDGCNPGGDEDDHDPETIIVDDGVEDEYDLALRKTLSAESSGPFFTGSTIQYNILVRNQGNVDALNIQLTDYIPAGLILEDSNWVQNGTLAQRVISRLRAGYDITYTIRFRIADNAPATIRNFAEISMDDGNDCDSIPDAINGNQEGETIATGMVDNQMGIGCNSGGDEDDHDYEDIMVGNSGNSDVYLIKSLASGQSSNVHIGDTVHYVIKVYNSGSTLAENYRVEDHYRDASNGGLALASQSLANWTDLNGIATYKNLVNIPAGGMVSMDIYFTITTSASGSVRNLAVVCDDSQEDCNPTPPPSCDDDTEVGTPEGCVEVNTSACISLSATPTSATNSLTSQLTCTGTGATSYRILVKDSSGNTLHTFNNSSASVTLSSVGTYTASCYVNNETITPNACTQTLSVTSGGGGGGGNSPKCLDIVKVSTNTIRCYGNSRIKSFKVANCNVDSEGNSIESAVKNYSTDSNNRRYAEFTCSNPNAQCLASIQTATYSGTPAWLGGNQCRLGTPTCGDGVTDPENNEQCDLGSLNGTSGVNCTSTCRFKSTGGGGTPDCDSDGNCVVTWPNGGELVFGPTGKITIGDKTNPLVVNGVKPYLYNNSDYDFSFDALCATTNTNGIASSKNPADVVNVSTTEICKDLTSMNRMIYAYEKIEMNIPTNFISNKANIPSGKDFGTENVVTTIKDNGILYDTAYFAGKLEVRVAKPAVSTVGGGTSYVKVTDSSNLSKVTNGKDTNFVGTTISNSNTTLSSDVKEVNNSSTQVITTVNTDKTNTENSQNSVDTSGVTTVATLQNYNNLSNVFIYKGADFKASNLPDLTSLSDPRTYIIENGNFIIDQNITSNKNIAFVVRSGNIIVKSNVTSLKGTYIAIQKNGIGGAMKGDSATDKQLKISGSVYADISNIVTNRYYIADTGNGLSVGTIVSFGSSLFTKPAPLVSQFVSEYLEASKIAQ